MSDSLSDADKIRNKRLAKLGTQTGSSNNEGKGDDEPPDKTPPVEPPEPLQTSTQAAADNNPFSELGLKQQEPPVASSAINIQPVSTTPAKRDSQSVPRARTQQPSRETPEEWEHRTLSSLFRLTLDLDQKKDLQGNNLIFLGGVREDLLQEGTELKLNVSILEQSLVEAASNQAGTKPLDYLLACWKRITKLTRQLKHSQADQAKHNVVQESKRLCMSYCIFAVTIPDLLGQEPEPTNPLTSHLLADPESDRGLCHDFLQEATSRFAEDDSIKGAFVEAIEQLSTDLSKMSMNDDYRPYVMALMSVVRYTPMVTALAEASSFIPPDVAAQDIEKSTLLGPFFQLSPLQGEVAQNYFSSPRTRDRAYIANSQHALRMTLQQHQSNLFDIVDRFIKAGKESREKMLDWFALTVNANHKRRAMRTDMRYVSSDGFMVNVTVCLDKLSEPFMDVSFSKIHRIEAEYFRRSPRVQIQDETKLNADQATSDRFYAQEDKGTSNFITEVFFLTVAAHHYGTESANTKLSDLRRHLKMMDKEIERFEAEREKYVNSPQTLALFDARLKQVKEQQDKGHCVLMATEGVLLDEQLQGRAMQFMRYVIVWLMRLVSGVDFPKQSLELPLPTQQPEVFTCLPEYLLEDVVDHFKFVTSHMPQVVNPTQCEELVMICITFLRSSEYIKNPGLKAGLVVILFHGVWPVRGFPQGLLGSLLNSKEFPIKYLLRSLMKFFIECESTGSHTQFYDKFNTRYEIFQVIKCIWGNVIYREQLEKEAQSNLEFFVRFVNLLLNDATFVLDESFSSFNNITALTKELREGGAEMDETTKQQKEEALDEAQRKAKSYMSLTNETLAMLKLFTDALADSFTMPEIVQRLADMLDYNLDALVGPKQASLKVENMQEYNFEPVSMLADIVDVFLNLSAKRNFHLAVARDGRSYKPSNFAQAATILARKGRKAPEELERWRKLCDTIARAKEEDEAETEDLGEVPDEFLDPLLATLMVDPVILPTSKSIVDRSTIRQMLLSDGLDPFNRAPLKIEDVVPDVELKARIDAFRAEKRGRKAAANGEERADSMDTA